MFYTLNFFDFTFVLLFSIAHPVTCRIRVKLTGSPFGAIVDFQTVLRYTIMVICRHRCIRSAKGRVRNGAYSTPRVIARQERMEKGVWTMAEMKEKRAVLTKEGYKKLEAELDHYISVRRNEIADQIAIARGFGDLSENAEYDEAKNEQSRIEAKIVEMENTLRNCFVVDDDDVNTETIGVGNTVKVMNQTLKKEQTFTIVGANETNPKEMKISSESPIGAMLLGKKVGQVVPIETPGGIVKMKVLEITR